MNTITPIRVMVVEDHPATRSGLAMVLAAFPDLALIGQASSGEDALASISQVRPDVVLMDIRLPGMDGIAATSEIVRRDPEVRVVVLTTFTDLALIARALEAGALSYLLKDVTAEELAAAIRAAHA